MADRSSALPPRPALRPGLRPARRGDGLLQVGLPPGPTVTAPDVPEARELVAALRVGLAPEQVAALGPVQQRLCQALLAADLLVDGRRLLEHLARGDTVEQRRQRAAAYAEHGGRTDEVLRSRAATPVTIGDERAPELAARLGHLVADAGFGTAAEESTPRVAVHVSVGEADRERTDAWMRADVPHLLVRCVEGRVRVGPFVVPGVTACLRCVDAHDGERDPRHALVVRQYAAAPPPGPAPEPVPYDLVDVALVVAVRDLGTWVDGRRPRSWSATVDVGTDLRLTEHRWGRHPACGCAWQQLVAG